MTKDTLDRIIRFSDNLRRYQLDEFEGIKPAVALTPDEMSDLIADPRIRQWLPCFDGWNGILVYGLRVFEVPK